jgi:hypothetical protein
MTVRVIGCEDMSRTLFVLTATATLLLPVATAAQAKRYPLESVEGLRFHNLSAEPAVLQGKKGLRATISEETLRRIESTQRYAQGLVWIEDLDFSNGVIEAEIAGALAPGATGEARGFVGFAFRVQEDLEMGAPTIKSAGIIPLSTSRFRSGPGPGFGRRHRANTKRTSTSCQEHGRRSKSRCEVNRLASTSTTTNSRR